MNVSSMALSAPATPAITSTEIVQPGSLDLDHNDHDHTQLAENSTGSSLAEGESTDSSLLVSVIDTATSDLTGSDDDADDSAEADLHSAAIDAVLSEMADHAHDDDSTVDELAEHHHHDDLSLLDAIAAALENDALRLTH
jgi:hypothetical protein